MLLYVHHDGELGLHSACGELVHSDPRVPRYPPPVKCVRGAKFCKDEVHASAKRQVELCDLHVVVQTPHQQATRLIHFLQAGRILKKAVKS